jgi:hypothetical protein
MKNRSKLGLLALAGAATLALILAACGEDTGGGDDAMGLPNPANGDAPALPPVGGESEGDESVALGPDSQSGDAQSITERKITRNASLELTVENVLDSVQQVEGITIAAGGFVSSSSLAVTEGDEDEDIETATVKIRVPADTYNDVISGLRDIGEVRAQSSETQEVTQEYTDLQSRLRNLEATEGRYLDLLSRAETIPDILSLDDRLSSVRGEIEQVQGRVNVLDDLTDLATISVRLVLPVVVEPAEGDGQGWAAEAWEKSWDASQGVLVVVGTIAIATLVFLPWFLIPTVIAIIAWRAFGRRITEIADKMSGPGSGAR